MPETLSLPLINSRPYRRIVPFLVVAFFLSYFSALLLFLPWYLIILLGLPCLFIPSLMSRISKKLKHIGRLTISYQDITIARKNGAINIFPIADLTELKINRNATYHLAEDSPYPPESHDNWISFTYKGNEFKMEFGIVTAEANDQFERLMRELETTYVDFKFTSI